MSNLPPTLEIEREFPFSIEDVFNAFIQPESILQWFGPLHCKTLDAQMDVRVGGKYVFLIEQASGNQFQIQGEYKTIDSPHTLVFTTHYVNLPPALAQDSIVTIALTELSPAQTKLTLRQQLATVPENMENRTKSWEVMLERLQAKLLSENS